MSLSAQVSLDTRLLLFHHDTLVFVCEFLSFSSLDWISCLYQNPPPPKKKHEKIWMAAADIHDVMFRFMLFRVQGVSLRKSVPGRFTSLLSRNVKRYEKMVLSKK